VPFAESYDDLLGRCWNRRKLFPKVKPIRVPPGKEQEAKLQLKPAGDLVLLHDRNITSKVHDP
jgi:hypothetical protein